MTIQKTWRQDMEVTWQWRLSHAEERQCTSTHFFSSSTSTHLLLSIFSVNFRLKITDRSFTYHAPVFWSSLPKDLRFPLSQMSYQSITQQIITNSLSPHLSFTPNLRLISSTNHFRLSLLAPLHSRFSGSSNLASLSFHITIIVTVSLIMITFHLLYGLLLFK